MKHVNTEILKTEARHYEFYVSEVKRRIQRLKDDLAQAHEIFYRDGASCAMPEFGAILKLAVRKGGFV